MRKHLPILAVSASLFLGCEDSSSGNQELCDASLLLRIVDGGSGKTLTDAEIFFANETIGESDRGPLHAYGDSLYRIYGKPGEYRVKVSHPDIGDHTLSGIVFTDTVMDGRHRRNSVSIDAVFFKEPGSMDTTVVRKPRC